MNKKGYLKRRNEYYNQSYKELQDRIKDIDYTQISYRVLTDIEEATELILDIFDTPFWEYYLLEDNMLTEHIFKNDTFILFELENMPCGLALLSGKNDDDNSIELCNLDIEDFLFLRGNGLGSKIVKLLNENIYPDKTIYGYAVSESSKFWARESKSYDEDIFESMRIEHLENGGEEDELFESEGLMYFSL